MLTHLPRVKEWQSWDLNPGLTISEPTKLFNYSCYTELKESQMSWENEPLLSLEKLGNTEWWKWGENNH